MSYEQHIVCPYCSKQQSDEKHQAIGDEPGSLKLLCESCKRQFEIVVAVRTIYFAMKDTCPECKQKIQ